MFTARYGLDIYILYRGIYFQGFGDLYQNVTYHRFVSVCCSTLLTKEFPLKKMSTCISFSIVIAV